MLNNIYLQMGGVKRIPFNSSESRNLSAHISGRLLAYTMLKVAFVVSVCFLLSACQQAYLIPDDEDKSARVEADTTDLANDSTVVTPDFDINGWDEAIDASFTFGGQPVSVVIRNK